MNSIEEIELVQSAKSGDVTAFESLYRHYNDRIYNFAKQITGSADDARDVAQESFIRAWKSLPRLRSNEQFGSWLHRIALNRSKDLLIKRKQTKTVSLDEPFANSDGDEIQIEIEDNCLNPEDTLISAEMQNAVQRAIYSLSLDHKLVVTMHHIEGMDIESIASALGIANGTVMSRLSRARAILRRKLAPHVEEK